MGAFSFRGEFDARRSFFIGLRLAIICLIIEEGDVNTALTDTGRPGQTRGAVFKEAKLGGLCGGRPPGAGSREDVLMTGNRGELSESSSPWEARRRASYFALVRLGRRRESRGSRPGRDEQRRRPRMTCTALSESQ